MTEADLLRENAELTASNARMRKALAWYADSIRYPLGVEELFSFEVCTDLGNRARSVLAETPAQSLAAIQDAASKEWREKYEAEHEAYIDIFTQLSAYEKRDLDKQDAARAEERTVVCKAVLDGILALNPSSWILPAIEDAISKVSRGNGGEAKCE